MDAVIEGLHAVHPGGIETWKRRTVRRRPGGDQELVVGLDELRRLVHPRVEVAHDQGLGRGVDLQDLVAHADVDALLPVLFGRPGDQRIGAVHQVADEVRDATRRVRGVAPPFERDDVQLVGGPAPARTRSRTHPRRVAADDDEPLRHDA